MKEQSHKDEMRAALAGDFKRMRARQEPVGETASAALPPVDTAAGPSAVVERAPEASWLERLRQRL